MTDIQALIAESARLWNNNEPAKAIPVCEEILRQQPDNIYGLINLAASIGAEEGITDQVREIFAKAYAVDSSNSVVLTNLAAIALDDCEYQKCMEYHDAILKKEPFNSEILSSKGRLLLTLGQYKEGWELYEHRIGLEHSGVIAHPFSKAAWRGAYCNKLLITCEQGLGDTIQFIRYASLCKQRVNKVYLLCAPEIGKLMETCPAVDAAVQTISENEFSEHISILSLPRIFGTTVETIPANVPYLFARKSKVEANLLKSDKLKVGLCWAGNPRKHSIRASMVDKKRTMRSEQFSPLYRLHEQVQFYNLQFGSNEFPAGLVLDPIRDAKDFEDTAAVIAQLDLVITVDTSVAHVAAAMGKPTWILSRFSGCWRWLTNRNDSPYYPAARLFRQPKPDDWETVISEVFDALKNLVDNRIK